MYVRQRQSRRGEEGEGRSVREREGDNEKAARE